jgi:hypothetical protein
MLKLPGLNVADQSAQGQENKSDKILLKSLAAGGLAVAGVLLSLWLWQILFGAAQWFSLAFALIAAACYLTAYFLKRPLLLKATLTGAGSFCTILAIGAGLGLGAFLPFWLADFLCPALGRFGGLAGLALLAVLHLGRSLVFRKSRLLDLALFCGIGAAWVAVNTTAQASFPPAPSTKADWASLLSLLFWSGLISGLLGLLLSFLKEWRWTARTFWHWSLACTLAGLALAVYFQQGDLALRCGLVLIVLAVALGLLFRRANPKPRSVPLIKFCLLQVGVVILLVLGLAALYLPLGEQLETVLLRNTLERYVQKTWSGVSGGYKANEAGKPAGTISGLVKDEQGKPLAGANVVVSDPAGFSWTAVSRALPANSGPRRLPGRGGCRRRPYWTLAAGGERARWAKRLQY